MIRANLFVGQKLVIGIGPLAEFPVAGDRFKAVDPVGNLARHDA